MAIEYFAVIERMFANNSLSVMRTQIIISKTVRCCNVKGLRPAMRLTKQNIPLDNDPPKKMARSCPQSVMGIRWPIFRK